MKVLIDLLIEGDKNVSHATKIQSQMRQYPAQKKLVHLKTDEAATVLQKNCRTFLAKKALNKLKAQNVLTSAQFESAKKILQTEKSTLSLMQGKCPGKTAVYFPKEFPDIILKASGEYDSPKRFKQMQLAREVLEKHGLTLLTIPKAKVYKDFIIEERAPLKAFSRTAQIGLYVEHQKEFTEAIKEFVKFTCEAYLGDLTGGTGLFADYLGRYDNVPLYIDEKNNQTHYKIALIDLERFSQKNSFFEDEMKTQNALIAAVTLFPYHTKEILEIGSHYLNDFTANFLRKINIAQETALKYIQILYHQHIKVLEKYQITQENPVHPPNEYLLRRKEKRHGLN